MRQRSRPSGSRVAPLPNVTPGPRLLQRLPQPATAFPTPGVGCWPKTTPSQGRAGGRQVGGGRARLGLELRKAKQESRQAHQASLGA